MNDDNRPRPRAASLGRSRLRGGLTGLVCTLATALVVAGCGDAGSSSSGGGGGAAPSVAPPPPPPGTAGGPAGHVNTGPRSGKRAGLLAIEVFTGPTLRVPIARDQPQGDLRVAGDTIVEGTRGVFGPPNQSQPVVTRIRRPDRHELVQVEVIADEAQSLPGKVFAKAATITPMLLRDDQRNAYQPNGYIWVRADGTQEIRYTPPTEDMMELPMSYAVETPYRDMEAGDRMFILYAVPWNTRLEVFEFAGQTQQIHNVLTLRPEDAAR